MTVKREQDVSSKLILYTAADILKQEASEQPLNVLSFRKNGHEEPAFLIINDITTTAERVVPVATQPLAGYPWKYHGRLRAEG